MSKTIVVTKNNIALDVRYKVNQELVNQMRFLRIFYSLQKIADYILDNRGLKISTSTVNYWTSDKAKKAQLKNNAKQKIKTRAKETLIEKKARIKRQGEYRLINWKRNPKIKFVHDIHSAKNETRSKRHTVQGLDIKKAISLKPLLFSGNQKIR